MDDPYDLLQTGLERLNSGRADEAIVPLERARRLQPEAAQIRETLGRTYLRLRFFDRALAEFDAIVERYPNDDVCVFYQGWCLLRMGRYGEASGQLRLAWAMRPDSELYRRAFGYARRRRDSAGR